MLNTDKKIILLHSILIIMILQRYGRKRIAGILGYIIRRGVFYRCLAIIIYEDLKQNRLFFFTVMELFN